MSTDKFTVTIDERLIHEKISDVKQYVGFANLAYGCFGSFASDLAQIHCRSALSQQRPFRRRKTSPIGNEGDYANGTAGTSFDFHRQGENQGTGRWQPVQIRQIFEITNIASCSDAMYNKIL